MREGTGSKEKAPYAGCLSYIVTGAGTGLCKNKSVTLRINWVTLF